MKYLFNGIKKALMSKITMLILNGIPYFDNSW